MHLDLDTRLGPFWPWITRFGESGILLPTATVIALWLALSARSVRPALAWVVPLSAAVLITTASKVAFLGFGVGIEALDFTGFSGHAMFAAAVYPMVAYMVTRGNSVQWQRVTLLLAYLAAGVVMVSRWEVGDHSMPEAVAGFALGAWASVAALRGLAGAPVAVVPGALAIGMSTWLVVAPLGPTPPVDSHQLVTRLALYLADRPVPYTRADLHHGIDI